MLFAARCKNNSASDEDTGVFEELSFPDFPPFMASFRKYKKDLSELAKIALTTDGMENCKNHELMPGFIKRMLDFDLEVDEMEREIFSMPERMKLACDYMDLFFQLCPSTLMKRSKLLQNI